MPATDGMPTPPLREAPGRSMGKALIVPAILAVLGIFVIAWGAGKIVHMATSTGFRFEAPGETGVTITEAGDYRLWLETRSIIDGSFQNFPDSLPPGSKLTITRMPEAEPVEQRVSGNMSMTINGVRRVALTDVTLPRAGEYRITLSGTNEKRFLYLDKAASVLEFFKGVGFAMVGGLLLLAAAIWGIIALTRRTNR